MFDMLNFWNVSIRHRAQGSCALAFLPKVFAMFSTVANLVGA